MAKLQEGAGTSVLPKQEQKVAALPSAPTPLASFTRSNSVWMVNVSLSEAATQFGYRVGEKGEFTDPGFIDALDQRTGARMPKTYFEMPPDQGKTTIYVTWRDRRGEQAEVFPINFDPTGALAGEQKATLEQFWTSWIAFREFQGMKVYLRSGVGVGRRPFQCQDLHVAEQVSSSEHEVSHEKESEPAVCNIGHAQMSIVNDGSGQGDDG